MASLKESIAGRINLDVGSWKRKEWTRVAVGLLLFAWSLYLITTLGLKTYQNGIILGLITGSVFAVASSGLVVTYTTSGIFNFSHGAIGMLAAFVYWQLNVKVGLPVGVAFVLVVLVGAPLLGALLEVLLIRRFESADVATQVVVTLALFVFFLGMGLQFFPPTEGRQANGVLPSDFEHSVSILGVNVSWQQLLTFFASLVVAVGLFYVLNRTRTGLAMRAVVDDRNLLALNGGKPSQVSMLSWAIGAGLAAFAGVLLAPTLGLEQLVLTLLVINAFAAAIIGRLSSLPATFVGAFVVGLALEFYKLYQPSSVLGKEVAGNWFQAFSGLASALPIVVLFGALLLVPSERLRAGRLVGAETPRVPAFLETVAGGVALVVGVALLSTTLSDADIARYGQGLAVGLVMLSIVPLTGYAAQLSLAQMSFAGFGAFVAGKLLGAPAILGGGSIVGVALAVVLTALLGMVVALPALRLQGLYLALATMSFAVFMDRMFFETGYGYGLGGRLEIARLDLGIVSFDSEQGHFIVMAVIFALAGMGVLAMKRGPFGRTLAALRDSPAACATLGLDLTRAKLAVFALSAGIAGLGGVMFGMVNEGMGPTEVRLEQGLIVLLLAVIGGVTTVSGALIGGIILVALATQNQGTVFMLIAAATVLLGRNPNGISYFISRRVGPYLPWRTFFEPGPRKSVAAPAGDVTEPIPVTTGGGAA